MFNFSIPECTKEEILRRYNKVKPILRLNGKIYGVRELSYEEIIGKGYSIKSKDLTSEIKESSIEVIKDSDFTCIHKFEKASFFNPSIYEVLSQIEDFEYEGYYEIIETPKKKDDLKKDEVSRWAFSQGYHVSKVRLYKKLY